MASNQLRTLRPNTPLDYVGRLRWFNPNKTMLSFRSNKQWLKFQNKEQVKLESKELWQLLNLINSHDHGTVIMDYELLAASRGEVEALALLRGYILEAHVTNELVRLGVDFTKPLLSQVSNYLKKLRRERRERYIKLQKVLRYIQKSHGFTHGTPLRELPQRSPNAPNTLPALSLAAA
jgi:hypothetical protein